MQQILTVTNPNPSHNPKVTLSITYRCADFTQPGDYRLSVRLHVSKTTCPNLKFYVAVNSDHGFVLLF